MNDIWTPPPRRRASVSCRTSTTPLSVTLHGQVLAAAASMVAQGGSSAGVGCYWPVMMDMLGKLASPIARFYLWVSTDHSNGAGGIWLATSNSKYGPFTYANSGAPVFQYTALGSQMETPVVTWDHDTSTLVMLWQQGSMEDGIGGNGQKMLRATSSDGVSWTAYANDGDASPVVLDWAANNRGGELHLGYDRLHVSGDLWTLLHRVDATSNQLVYGRSYSLDKGKHWTTDSRQFCGRTNLLGSSQRYLSVQSPPFVFRINGDWWGLFNGTLDGSEGDGSDGVTVQAGTNSQGIGLYPLNDDLMTPRSAVRYIIEPSAEGREVTSPFGLVVDDDLMISYIERDGPGNTDEQHVRMASVSLSELERWAA